MSRLVAIIDAADPAVRDRSIDEACRGLGPRELLAEAVAVDAHRRACRNLYRRVRGLFILAAIHRYHLPAALERPPVRSVDGLIPAPAVHHLLGRRFEEAIDLLLECVRAAGPSPALSSALAVAYRELGLQTLANQVRQSVRSIRGNQWMFRVGHPADQPLRIRRELLGGGAGRPYPVLHESTPVRMDLSHAGWSDIFFLGMDCPEAARVLNVSVDLGVHGRDAAPRPPVEAFLRVIDEPLLRLTSIDLDATADITDLAEVFDFGRDYLGLLKAAVIASGIIPPGIEGSGETLADLLAATIGPGLGLEMVSSVNGIPKGSRLAVSTNLLASLIAVCMRATGQAGSLEEGLDESERRLVAARAILGEWLGGSGGGWQDSGGVWPAAKLIRGVVAAEGDPEYGISRGRLLPRHDPVPLGADLQESLVLVHGGMAQNVGPILEMVTEKYLLRSGEEWRARTEAGAVLDEIIAGVAAGDVRRIAAATTRNFTGPIRTIIPWASNAYTETLIEEVAARFGERFWGFWMLGGMSGGGMGFIFDPRCRLEGQDALASIMAGAKRRFEDGLPFAMDPVVYDFAVNARGTWCTFHRGADALLPPGYYARVVPQLLRSSRRDLTEARRVDLESFGAACRTRPDLSGMVDTLFDRLFPAARETRTGERELRAALASLGFDEVEHEQIRADLRAGRIGLAQNRLPASMTIEDVSDADVDRVGEGDDAHHHRIGTEAIRRGEAAIVTLAAGVGSRWTQGAGVVKALNPFCRIAGAWRTFLDVHVAKARRTARLADAAVPHVVTTSHLTHAQLAAAGRPVILSPGRAVGLRMVPMVRDLRFFWEETARQVLDEQREKMRESVHAALAAWAERAGEASDYTDNTLAQCLHPVGHWYEVPNMIRNGVLARLLHEHPRLRWIMLHNIDTVGTDLDPAILGRHMAGGAGLSVEVIPRHVEDRGGGLARVNGRPRLVEGLAMPREDDEWRLRYYNTLTTWIDLDALLRTFGLSRDDVLAAERGDDERARVAAAIRGVAARMPTYVTLKDVKKRWGHGQEDVFPVTQFEKLWGDMTAVADLSTRYFVVPRVRGRQLKDVAQLDGWLRDGSAAAVEKLGDWD